VALQQEEWAAAALSLLDLEKRWAKPLRPFPPSDQLKLPFWDS
jgi:hypothetical protein